MTNLALKRHEIQNAPITYYVLSGMAVNPTMLDVVFDREDRLRSEHVENERLRKVTDFNIAKARIGVEGCRCHVYPGMTVDALMRLGGGCKEGTAGHRDEEGKIVDLGTAGYTCPRLSALRRLYDH